nr:PREDICTED: protein D3-like [Bemisia tabaci]
MGTQFLTALPSILNFRHLCIILVVLNQIFSTLSHTGDDILQFKLQTSNIVPLIIPIMPQHELSVVYKHTTVKCGNKINGYEMMEAPVEVTWPAKNDFYYTLFMIGPDSRVREQPIDRNWLHWLVTNIKGNDAGNGDEIAEYCGSLAGYEIGLHRLIYVVFENPSGKKVKLDLKRIDEEAPYEKRTKFDLLNFTKQYGMHKPVAANFAVLDLEFRLPGQ